MGSASRTATQGRRRWCGTLRANAKAPSGLRTGGALAARVCRKPRRGEGNRESDRDREAARLQVVVGARGGVGCPCGCRCA